VCKPCATFAFDVCSDSGRLTLRKRNAVMLVLVRSFKRGTALCRLLIDGWVVLEFIGTPILVAGDGGPAGGNITIYVHVGLYYMSPRRPTFMEAGLVGNPGETPPDCNRRYIQAAEFVNMILLIRKI